MPRARVLLVEPDDALRHTITNYLRGQGFEVDAADNGASALARMRHQIPDAVLLEIRLPDLAGEQFVSSYRADSRLAAVPCVIVSADTYLSGTARAIDARAALAKPVDLDIVGAVLRRVCGY